MKFHVLIDGGDSGPLDLAEVVEGVKSGRFDGEAPAWCEGQNKWRPLRELVALPAVPAPAPVIYEPPRIEGGHELPWARPGDWLCLRCGVAALPAKKYPGSLLITLLLLLVWIIPGLIYEIWRWSAAKRVCRRCGADQLIPVSSPEGRQRVQLMVVSEPHAVVVGRGLAWTASLPGRVWRWFSGP